MHICSRCHGTVCTLCMVLPHTEYSHNPVILTYMLANMLLHVFVDILTQFEVLQYEDNADFVCGLCTLNTIYSRSY